jgi:hypothetical protein
MGNLPFILNEIIAYGSEFNKGRYILLCHERGVKAQPRSAVSIIHDKRIIRWWVTRHTCYISFGPANLNLSTPFPPASAM